MHSSPLSGILFLSESLNRSVVGLSMSDPIIRVENLGKKYIIGHQQQKERYTALRDVIANGVRGLTQSFKPKSKSENPNFEEFWALKDVSFEVNRGDRIGIIGRNGAGKSTLLKILSRITEPTTGRIQIKGRVASLLEVGTGFHPELTGRENIFLNGAILGMGKEEIRRKFDEIVAFAEVEKFLDTPVKRYSSGMYVRLAFAVAAHLEPEILIVDEVLAVGDAAFQKKCLGKMEDVAKNQGRTVLFVSHNMSAIQALCDFSLVLNSGRLVANQRTAQAVKTYLESSLAPSAFTRPDREIKRRLSVISGRIQTFDDWIDSKAQMEIEVLASEDTVASLDFRFSDNIGAPIGFGSLGTLKPEQLINFRKGMNLIRVSFSTRCFAVGSFSISLDITQPDAEYYDRVENCLSFDVVRPPSDGYIRVLNQAWGYGSFEVPLHGEVLDITLEEVVSQSY